MNETNDPNDALVISYLTLRKAVGILGLALPFLLAFGGMLLDRKFGVHGSISGYYYTGMRNVLVGTLCAIGTFMMSYRGYERKDDVAGDLACLFAIGVALCPTNSDLNSTTFMGLAHYLFAALLFLTLAYFSLCLFTKTDSDVPPTRQKLRRNAVYKICGYAILGAVVLIVVVKYLPEGLRTEVARFNPVFWLESIAVIAFGISWLTKGEAILGD